MNKITEFLKSVWKVIAAIAAIFLVINLNKEKKEIKKRRKKDIDHLKKQTDLKVEVMKHENSHNDLDHLVSDSNERIKRSKRKPSE